jgi:uncharacterized membrane-anchored protein YhcB (DUF1043 family)
MPKTCKQFCQAYKRKTLKLMNALDANLMKTLTPAYKKKYKAYQAKSRKALLKKIPLECKMYYCNKTCKNTLFEAGRNKYPPLPKGYTKNKEMTAFLSKLQKQTKKEIFGDKDNVLKDGFYEKLSSQKVKKLKQNGATSGCVKMLFTDSPAL